MTTTIQDIEIAIREIIRRVYCSDYCGRLKVKTIKKCCPSNNYCEDDVDCEDYGFELLIYLNKDERPLSLAFDGSLENFLIYITKELRSRRLHYTEYYYGYQVIKENCDVSE